MMQRFLLLCLAGTAAAAAADPVQPPPGAAAAMQQSLAQQRLSIQKQVQSVNPSSFFTLPPPGSIDDAALPDCEPLPEERLQSLVEEASREAQVQPDLLRGVIRQESGGRPCAVSAKGAEGLMQLMPETSRQLAVRDPFDPRENLRAGAKLLRQLLGRYQGDVAKALAAYNAGAGRVDQAGGTPSIPETLNYVSSILASLPH